MGRRNNVKLNLLQWSWTEIGFFIFYFLILQIVTDLQFRYNESYAPDFGNLILYRLITAIYQAIAFAIYYKAIIPRGLITKRYLTFIIGIIVFLFAYDWWLRVWDWILWHLQFLPYAIRKSGREHLYTVNLILGRQTVAVTLASMFALTALAYFIQTARTERLVNKLNQDSLQLQLDSLKAQLHPHFLFNTLNNIYSLAQEQSLKTPAAIAKLSELLRYVLNETGAVLVPLADEISFLQNYISLERMRFLPTMNISFEFQGRQEGHKIPPLLFIPFVENAFKHGLQNLDSGYIEIIMVLADEELTIQIKNSKPAILNDNLLQGGLGLANVKLRLNVIYPGRHILSIKDGEREFEVNLTINLNDSVSGHR